MQASDRNDAQLHMEGHNEITGVHAPNEPNELATRLALGVFTCDAYRQAFWAAVISRMDKHLEP